MVNLTPIADEDLLDSIRSINSLGQMIQRCGVITFDLEQLSSKKMSNENDRLEIAGVLQSLVELYKFLFEKTFSQHAHFDDLICDKNNYDFTGIENEEIANSQLLRSKLIACEYIINQLDLLQEAVATSQINEKGVTKILLGLVTYYKIEFEVLNFIFSKIKSIVLGTQLKSGEILVSPYTSTEDFIR